MDKNNLERYFFIGSLFVVSIIIFFIFLPFMEELILASIFALVLNPIYKKLVEIFGNRRSLSAFVMILLFAIVIIVPTVFLTRQILEESQGLYNQLTSQTETDYASILTQTIEGPIKRFFPDFSFDIREYVGVGTDVVISRLSSVVSGVFNIVTGTILMFFSLFFFLRDGSKFKKILVGLSPMNNEYDEQIFNKVKQAVFSTVRGVILIAIIQGFLAGLGMKIFGVPNATLWGSVAALASLVPGFGTALVFIPAVAYMFVVGNTAFAVGLLLWGAVIVGLVDNMLGPYLYSRGVKIHQLIMLFAVLGGLSLFGPIGFIFGPVLVALFFALIEIYQTLILKQEKSI